MTETKEQELKPCKLGTVSDVLDWAFDYLGIKALCRDECCCGASVEDCEDTFLSCEIAKVVPCTGRYCDCENCPKLNHTGGDCTQSITITAPPKSAPQWSQEPPTEEGEFWLMFGYEREPYIARIYSNNNEGLYLILRSGRIAKLTGFIKRHPEALWCKVVSPPPLPKKEGAKS